MIDAVLLTTGLVVLLGGAWLVVRAAVRLAVHFGLSRVLVGATIVAFGTSAPEFVVNLLAAAEDSPGLAIGNIVGSNVANVALVLGIGAMILPIAVHARLLRWEIPVLVAATAAMLLVAADGGVSRFEGAALFVGLIAFVVLSVRRPEAAAALEEDVGGAVAPRISPAAELSLLVAGLAALTGGADLLVRGATGLAEAAGLSDVAIGAFVVALGTSLPEVATTAVAAFRREHEIAVANVVGSNIFNVLGVIGLTSVLIPLDIDRGLFEFEMLALALSTVVLIPLARNFRRIGRPQGAVLLAAYVAFVVVVLVRG